MLDGFVNGFVCVAPGFGAMRLGSGGGLGVGLGLGSGTGDYLINHDATVEIQLAMESMCQNPHTSGSLCPNNMHTLFTLNFVLLARIFAFLICLSTSTFLNCHLTCINICLAPPDFMHSPSALGKKRKRLFFLVLELI